LEAISETTVCPGEGLSDESALKTPTMRPLSIRNIGVARAP
jgi:hypothetical protein